MLDLLRFEGRQQSQIRQSANFTLRCVGSLGETEALQLGNPSSTIATNTKAGKKGKGKGVEGWVSLGLSRFSDRVGKWE